MNDPIVEEIRSYREQYAARFNYDLAAICRDLRERQTTCGATSYRDRPRRSRRGYQQTPKPAMQPGDEPEPGHAY